MGPSVEIQLVWEESTFNLNTDLPTAEELSHLPSKVTLALFDRRFKGQLKKSIRALVVLTSSVTSGPFLGVTRLLTSCFASSD